MINRIETTDLFKASYFICSGGILKESKIVNCRQIRFVIEGEGLEEAEHRFYTGQASIDPLRLKECLNHLRDLLERKLNETKTRGTRYDHRNRYSKQLQTR